MSKESREMDKKKCCMCGETFYCGFEMSNGDYVCATHECCYEYCKNEGQRIYQKED